MNQDTDTKHSAPREPKIPTDSVFPPLTFDDVLSCQFSSWYSVFQKHTIRAKIIRPLSDEFRKFLDADGITVPEGSEDNPDETTLSDSSDDDGEEDSTGSRSSAGDKMPRFCFPELTQDIRRAINSYGAVFPKLNWTSPRDASWMLAPSTPLKCTSPADVFLFLKSSDFISHDIDSSLVFEGCIWPEGSTQAGSAPLSPPPHYELELVLKKWYVIETSRELRCFVRDNCLIGISQRDTTFYEHLNESATHSSIRESVIMFWNDKIRPWWTGGANYIFDLLLTRDLSSAHIVDFNPYAPRTDALLFTYEELRDIFVSSKHPENSRSSSETPEFRVITSRSHPAASRATPQHAHNMMPREALELSAGQSILDFQETWAEQLSQAMKDTSDDEETD